jgi:hypothetical protein
MQLAIYDLLGALFAAPDLSTISSHTDKLFKRVCGIIKDRFAEPDFARWRPKRGSRCATFRSSLRREALPALISYIRSVWIMPRASCIAGGC